MTINTQSKILKGKEADEHIITGQARVPNYKKYLKISGNKDALCSFVSNYITSAGPKRITSENTVILAGGFENGEEVKRVSKSGMDCLTDLYSDQKEADTRLTVTCNTACTVTFSSHCEM